jgi:hypothetical protein
MLFSLGAFLLWLILVVGICAIMGAGGGADDRTEKWYSDRQHAKESAPDRKRGAA